MKATASLTQLPEQTVIDWHKVRLPLCQIFFMVHVLSAAVMWIPSFGVIYLGSCAGPEFEPPAAVVSQILKKFHQTEVST